MKCPVCGEQIKEGASFCGQCGARLSVAPEDEKATRGKSSGKEEKRETEESGEKKNKKEQKNSEKKKDRKEQRKSGEIKKKKGGFRKIAVFVCLILAAGIISSAAYLAANGYFDRTSSVVFGEISVDEIYFMAGREDTATFTVQAAGSEKKIELCDAEGNTVGEMGDDGENGDEEAGDGIYTCTIIFDEEETGEASYYAKEKDVTSESVSVYFFEYLDEAGLTEAEQTLEEVSDVLNDIEAGYAGESGYVTADDFQDIFSEADTYLADLVDEGIVLRYVVDDSSIYIKLSSGFALCFHPTLAGTRSGETDEDLVLTFYEVIPMDINIENGDLGYMYDYIDNLSEGATYTGAQIDLDFLQNLPSNQIIVWSGHGVYSSETGPSLLLDLSYSECLESMSENEQQLLFGRDYLVLSTSWNVAVTAKYIENYVWDVSNDLIFLGSCSGIKDDRLAKAFIDKGATAVLGFNEDVLGLYGDLIIYYTLAYMSMAYPDSDQYYTMEQALGRAKDALGTNDAVYFNQVATDEDFQIYTPNGAEAWIITKSTLEGGGGSGQDIRLSTETGSLSGTTYYWSEETDTDIPAPGVTVSLYQEGELYRELTTDENGEYSIPLLPAGAYDIVFSLEGYSNYYLEETGVYRDRLTEADGYFYESGELTGTVVDAITGEVIGEAEVELRLEDDLSMLLHYLNTTNTDGNGEYLFDLKEESETDTEFGSSESLVKRIFTNSIYNSYVENNDMISTYPEGHSGYILAPSGKGTLTVSKEGYTEKTLEITVNGYGHQKVDVIELYPDIEVCGYVCDAVTGETLSGVSVQLSGAQMDAETDEEDWSGSLAGEIIEGTTDLTPGTDSLGYFDIITSGADSLTVIFQLDGYESVTIQITVDATMINLGTIELQPEEESDIPADAVEWGGHKYYYYDISCSWDEAEAFCESVGGHLVTLTSAGEQDFVYNYAVSAGGAKKIFIGLSDAGEEGNWSAWVTGEKVVYTNWGTGEPDNDANKAVIQNYAAMYTQHETGDTYEIQPGEWDDIETNCTFICEWEVETTQETKSMQDTETTLEAEVTQNAKTESTQDAEKTQETE